MMRKKKILILLVPIICLLSASVAHAQYIPSNNGGRENVLDSMTTAATQSHAENATFCSNSSTIKITALGNGDMAENNFRWVVYGGRITAYNGTKLVEDETATYNSNQISFLTVHGKRNIHEYYITITWQATAPTDYNGYGVAVQQTSTIGCLDKKWSYIKMTKGAAAPVLALGSIPSVCKNDVTVNLPYTITSGTPTTYSIVWSSGGLANITDASLTSSPITVSTGSLTNDSYSGTLYVKNSDGCASSNAISFNATLCGSLAVSATNSTLCPAGDPNLRFNGENGSYKAGVTEIEYIITRTDGTGTWGFDYNLSITSSASPNYSLSDDNYTQYASKTISGISGSSTSLKFYITNQPGKPGYTATLTISNQTGASSITTNSDVVTVNAMPSIGDMNP